MIAQSPCTPDLMMDGFRNAWRLYVLETAPEQGADVDTIIESAGRKPRQLAEEIGFPRHRRCGQKHLTHARECLK